MKPKIYFFLTVLTLLVLASVQQAVSGPPVFYKKKVQVQPLENAPGWIGTYNPGLLISNLIQLNLLKQKNIVLVRFVNSPSPSQKKAKGKGQDSTERNGIGMYTPAQIILTGRIIKYRPALPIKLESTRTEKKIARSAEIHIEFQIIQGQTKRFLTGFVVSAKSIEGEFPLGYSQSSLNLRNPDFYKTFMGKALTKMIDKLIPMISDFLDQLPLEGQVLAVEPKEEVMIINVGRKSGVEIRDDFIVYSVDAHFPDPLYKEDIGDRMTKLGVVRVVNVQEGFSEAVIMAGGDFVKGNLVRSKRSKLFPGSIKGAPQFEPSSSPSP